MAGKDSLIVNLWTDYDVNGLSDDVCTRKEGHKLESRGSRALLMMMVMMSGDFGFGQFGHEFGVCSEPVVRLPVRRPGC